MRGRPRQGSGIPHVDIMTAPPTSWRGRQLSLLLLLLLHSKFESSAVPTVGRSFGVGRCTMQRCPLARLLTGITPPTWYGSPQFAKLTYGPFSNMVMWVDSERRRRRAAHEAAGRGGLTAMCIHAGAANRWMPSLSAVEEWIKRDARLQNGHLKHQGKAGDACQRDGTHSCDTAGERTTWQRPACML